MTDKELERFMPKEESLLDKMMQDLMNWTGVGNPLALYKRAMREYWDKRCAGEIDASEAIVHEVSKPGFVKDEDLK